MAKIGGDVMESIGERIAEARKSLSLSQAELALRCDKDKQSLNRLEKGRINPSAFYLSEIATELKVPLWELLDFE